MRPRIHATGSRVVAALLAVLWAVAAMAQLEPPPHERGATGLGLALRRLPVTASVLYVTAHPDDEDNGVLVRLSRGEGVRTVLMTLTRGEGGQNQIGPELFDALGVLRSEELLAVHRFDGVEQRFGRAIDFGYSFSVEETFDKWGHDEILADVVRMVRELRPDVILTLPREGPGGGQHHMAAGRLAVEAFRAAADPARFPDQVAAGLRPWQARKVYEVGLPVPQDGADPTALRLDTSAFDPLLGYTWEQFGSLARAQHRCQGVGQLMAAPGQGEGTFRLVDSVPAVTTPERHVLDGVDRSIAGLARFVPDPVAAAFLEPGLAAVAREASRAREEFDPEHTARSLAPLRDGLVAVRRLLGQVRAGELDSTAREELVHRLEAKQRDFEQAVALAHGLVLRAVTDDPEVVPGQSFTVLADVYNPGPEPVGVDALELELPRGWTARLAEGRLAPLGPGARLQVRFRVDVPTDAQPSQPYWRREPGTERYSWEAAAAPTLPFDPPGLVARLDYSSQGVSASLADPVHSRYAGPWVGGEKQKLLQVVPALSVDVEPRLAILPAASEAPREFRVSVVNHASGPAVASLRFEAPEGFQVDPSEWPVSFAREDEQVSVRLTLTPPAGRGAGEQALDVIASAADRDYRDGHQVVAYDHIQERRVYRPASVRLVSVGIRIAPDSQVGYVMGVGDRIPDALAQIGVPVTLLGPDELAFGELSRFSAIVTGVRAYQVRDDLRAFHERLMSYVRDGGHLVVMYNGIEFNVPDPAQRAAAESYEELARVPSPFAPYPGSVTFDRVSVEEAPVVLLDPKQPLLTTPNRIGAADFEGWVQERGLQFFGADDPHYVDLLASEDPWPENPGRRRGLLTTARLGKGSWTYVGLGLFRELPAGVPGAYRILANLVAPRR